MNITRDKEYYKAESEGTLGYYCSGIPKKYWTTFDMPYPSEIAIKTDNKNKPFKLITVGTQVEWLNKLSQDVTELDKNYLIGIGSIPTDHAAMIAACNIAKFAMTKNKDIFKFYNVQMVSSSNLDSIKNEKYNMLIIHNVVYDMTNDRIQAIRDALEEHESSLRIIVVSDSDPVEFAAKKLKMSLNGAFYFTKCRGTVQI